MMSLMQLCAPCQAAIRSGHIAQITGPITRREPESLTYLWSCALCIAVLEMRGLELKKKGGKLRLWRRDQVKAIQIGAGALYQALSFQSNPHRTPKIMKGASNSTPISPIGDITDILLISAKLHHSDCQFKSKYAIVSPHPAQTNSILRVVPKEKIDKSIVKRWLSYCVGNHRICVSESPKSELQLLLIDVRRKCLVSATAARYFALSYVWGKVDQFLLRQADLPKLQKENALLDHWDQIAPVLKDAIAFVDSLSESYLWVDTICIIQDSDGRHSYLSRMNEVYRGAVCTLVAIDSVDAMSRLPGVCPNTRDICHLGTNVDLEVVRRRPDLASVCMPSAYEGRAWTFQERTLSRRCLYFTREQLYFQCQQEIWSEDRYEHYEQSFGIYPSLDSAIRCTSFQSPARFSVYGQLVQLYSKRELSYSSDRLNAFSGIANDLSEKWGWEFAVGLPTLFLDMALMWVSTTQSLRRIRTDDLQQYLPTWSWAGWADGVHYRMALELQRESLVNKFAITTVDDVKIFHIPSNEALGTAEKVQKRPCYDSEIQEDEGEGLDYIHPDLIRMSNLLIFWAETIPMHKLSTRHTTQTFPCRIYGEEIPNKFLCRLVGTRGSAGLLMHSGELPHKPQDSYQYILISRSTDKPFISSVINRSLDSEDESVGSVYSDYYERTRGITLRIMLIRHTNKGYAERVAVGQVHEVAWNDATPMLKKIYLG